MFRVNNTHNTNSKQPQAKSFTHKTKPAKVNHKPKQIKPKMYKISL